MIIKAIKWCLCLGLRGTAWTGNRLHERLKSGPAARLWAASDHELLAEAKRRGLLKKKRAKALPTQTQTVRFEEPNVILAIKTVAVLQEIKESQAEAMVRQALGQWRGSKKPSADEIAALVLKPA